MLLYSFTPTKRPKTWRVCRTLSEGVNRKTGYLAVRDSVENVMYLGGIGTGFTD